MRKAEKFRGDEPFSYFQREDATLPGEGALLSIPLPVFFFGLFPAPESPTDCGAPVTLSKISSSPLCLVVSVGLKVTDTLQLLPGASVFWHCDLTANTGGDALSISILTAKVFFLPAFLILTLLGLLVFPTAVLLPNPSERGLTISFWSIGSGVAVGVAVIVGV
jgi:hypothetical protein